MKIIKVQKHLLGGTDVTLHVPEFENFGKRLDELNRLANEADPVDPAEVEAITAKLKSRVSNHQKKARKKLKAMPAGAKKDMHTLMLGMMEQMAESMNEPEEEESTEQGAGAEEPQDLQHLALSVPKGLKWNKQTQGLVQQFFTDWPQTRPVVLRAIFDHYKKIYPDALTLFPGDKGVKFILPEPTKPEAIADLFYVASMYLHQDGSIGLSGNCTWDEEHGWGLMLKAGKVKAVDAADIAFC